MIKVITPPALAVSVAQAKMYGRISGSSEDTLISSLLQVAQNQVEEYTGRVAAPGTFQLVVDGWPETGLDQFYRFPAFRINPGVKGFLLPGSPLVSVTSVKYVDETDTLATLSPSLYYVDNVSLPGRLVFRSDTSFPALGSDPSQFNRIQVEFVAGVANPIVSQAILMCFVNFYENRSSVITGTIVTELPFSVKHILRSQRIEYPFSS